MKHVAGIVFAFGVLGSFLLVSAQPVQADNAAPCKCIDVGDIRERMRLAEAAIKEYENQIQLTKSDERFSEQGYARVQGAVHAAMKKVRTPGRMIPTGHFKTESGDAAAETDAACQIFVAPYVSPCLKDSLTRHEQIHQRECKKKQNLLGFGYSRWMESKTLIEVAREEIESFSAELQYLQSVLPSAQQTCKPRRAYTSRIRKPGFDDGVHRRIWHYF